MTEPVLSENKKVFFQNHHFDWIPYTLNSSQTEAYNALAQDYRFVAQGGGVRSGKSFLAMLLAYKWSRENNDNVGIIVRNTYKEIESILFHELLRKYFLDKLLKDDQWHYDRQNHTIHFDKEIGNSMIIFQALRNSQGTAVDLNRALMGRGIGWFVIDQAEMGSESNFNTLIHRMSLKNVPRRQGFINFNPRGHDYCWKLFVNPATKRKDSYFVQTKTDDNSANIAGDYLDLVKNTMHNDWVNRWIDGNFDNWEGLVYPMWQDIQHIVDPIPELPEKYKLYISIDPGLNNPTAIGFYTQLENGIVLKFDEYYERGKLISDWYKDVLRICKKWGREKVDGYSVIDPHSIKRSPESGRSVIDTLYELNINNSFNLSPYPGNGDLNAGLDRVGSYLTVDPSLKHPFTGKMGSPRLLICNNCIKTIWEFSQYIWKKSPDLNVDMASGSDFLNLPEKPLDRNNHAMDEIRYFIMTLPPTPIDINIKRIKPTYKPLYETTGY